MVERVTTVYTKIYWVPERKRKMRDGSWKTYRKPVVRFPFPRTVPNKLGINVKGEHIRVVVEVFEDGSFKGYIPKEEIKRILRKQYPIIDELR